MHDRRRFLIGFSGCFFAGAGRDWGKDFAGRLPAGPLGIGESVANRGAWEPLAKSEAGRRLIQQAEGQLKGRMEAFSADLYQEFFRNGNRSNFQNHNNRRWARLRILVKAECLEGRGRFLAAVDATVRALCSDPSWCLPAHDRGGENFKGGKPFVDLAVAMCGWEMASVIRVLEGRLDTATAGRAVAQVERRLTGPVMAQIRGEDPEFYRTRHWWSVANHNWNAVCTAGAVGSVLLLPSAVDRRERALAWAKANMQVFLGGFAADGYCSEGIGYWSYGFGHYALLAELVRRHSGGADDWLADPRASQVAAAALGQQLVPGLYPAFADAGVRAKPAAVLVDYLARRGLVPAGRLMDPAAILGGSHLLYETLLYLFAEKSGAKAAAAMPQERCWLPEGGVYVGRGQQQVGLAVAWKGGHNAEHHNHNDVGSTLVACNGQLLLGDPGAMVYTAETFGRDRYRFPVMASYGHSVPVVDGKLQVSGAKARGRVLEQAFTEGADRMRIDLRSCYPVEGLEQLERSWQHLRADGGRLVVEDRFAAARPLSFESVWIGMAEWRRLGDTSYVVTDGKVAVKLELEASQVFVCAWVRLRNPGHETTVRMGICLKENASTGWIRSTVSPATPDELQRATTVVVMDDAPAKLADAGRVG